MLVIYLYLIALYVRPQDWVPAVLGWPTAYIIMPIGMLIGASHYFGDPKRFALPQNRLIPLYLLTIFVSTWLAVGIGGAGEQLELFLKRAVVFFMIAWMLTTTERAEKTVWVMLALSLFLAYQAYLQGSTGYAWGGLTRFPGYDVIRVRWYGDWDGPNVLGILFVMAIGMTLELIFGPKRFWVRLMGVGLASAFLYAMFLTNSRGAVLAVGCSLLFYFRDRFRRHPIALVVAAAAIAGLVSFGPSRMGEVSSSESSAHERTWLWEQGLVMLRQNPLLGVGRGEFIKRVDLHLIAHNNYVQNFSETGLIGFTCFIAILWFTFRGCLLVVRPESGCDPRLVSLARMAMSALVGFGAATFFVVMELDLLYFVLGLAAAVYLIARHQHPEVPALTFSRFDILVIGSSVVGIVILIWLAAVAQIV